MYELGIHEEVFSRYGEDVAIPLNVFSTRECSNTLQVSRGALK